MKIQIGNKKLEIDLIPYLAFIAGALTALLSAMIIMMACDCYIFTK